jgi:uncharacterized protein
VTPGEAELAQRELDVAREALRAARLLVDAAALRDATSRLYYAVFHAARAALLVQSLHAKTHSGQITLFEKTFGATPLLGQLFALRGEADYGREEFTTTADDIRRHLADGEAFVDRCRKIVDEAVARGPDEPDPPPDY